MIARRLHKQLARLEVIMKKIKIGDKVTVEGKGILGHFKKTLIFAAMDNIHTHNGVPCVFLASDVHNTNTYERFSQQFLNKHGYCI